MDAYEFIGAVERRREPLTPPLVYGADRNVRPVTQPPSHDAPDPVRETDFATRAAKMPIAVRFNIADIQSVAEDFFLIDLEPPPNEADYLEGAQLSWDERINIERGNPEAYGSMQTLTPPQYGEEYRI